MEAPTPEPEEDATTTEQLLLFLGQFLLNDAPPTITPPLLDGVYAANRKKKKALKKPSPRAQRFLIFAGAMMFLSTMYVSDVPQASLLELGAPAILQMPTPPLILPPQIIYRLSVTEVIQHQSRQLHTRDVYRIFLATPHLCRVSTRCSPEELQAIVTELSPAVRMPRDKFGGVSEDTPRRVRSCLLSTENRICMVLVWLAHYDIAERVGAEFGVRGDLVHHDIYHILPIIIEQYSHLIQWPGEAERASLYGRIPYFHYAIGFTNASHSPVWKPGNAADVETEYWCTHGEER